MARSGFLILRTEPNFLRVTSQISAYVTGMNNTTPKNMDYKECPHYNELFIVLAEGKDLEDISFEIDEVESCRNCLKENDVCELWVMLGFVKHMNISDAKIAIGTLDEQLKNIVFKLISNLDSNKGDSN